MFQKTPFDFIDISWLAWLDVKGEDGTVVQSSGLDALHSKHPPPVVPPKSALLDGGVLPPFDDVEITGGLINKIANMIQGSGGSWWV